jgi:uncharacterized lipoprotein YehR (DUF1307 family)
MKTFKKIILFALLIIYVLLLLSCNCKEETKQESAKRDSLTVEAFQDLMDYSAYTGLQ